MANISISRGNTLPDSSAKADFHNLIDSSSLSFSELVNADVNASAAIANSKLNLTTMAQGIAMSSKQFLFAKGADVASATTMTLGLDGNCYDITGTTTIQTINHTGSIILQAGSVIILHFDGIVTLTDDTGNLELGGTDLTVAAEDEVILKSDGTLWHLVASSAKLTTFDYEFDTTVAISNVATLEVQDLAAGFDYLFSFQNCAPQNDNVTFSMRTSPDAGGSPSFDTSGYSDTASATATEINIIGAVGNATGETFTGDIVIYNPGDSGVHTYVRHIGVYANESAGLIASVNAGGKRNSAAVVQAVEFKFSAGNLATGTLNIFKRKLS